MLRHARTLRYRDPRAGSSMVEFALVGIIVLMLVIGIFEVGRTVWNYNTLAYAARQASRYASVRSNLGAANYSVTPNPIDTVVFANAAGLDPAQLTVTKTWTPDNSPGGRVQITVSYPVDLIAAPLFAAGTPHLTVKASSTLTILN
ncbi:MAG: TadE/TadG family type IV pilus assembly protein [Bryobacterales bacterium]